MKEKIMSYAHDIRRHAERIGISTRATYAATAGTTTEAAPDRKQPRQSRHP